MKCDFCKKDLSREISIVEIRGKLANEKLAILCNHCGQKYFSQEISLNDIKKVREE